LVKANPKYQTCYAHDADGCARAARIAANAWTNCRTPAANGELDWPGISGTPRPKASI